MFTEVWCSHNNLELNTLKTVEMIVDFRRNTPALLPLPIMDSTVAAVESFVLFYNSLVWVSQRIRLKKTVTDCWEAEGIIGVHQQKGQVTSS